MRFVHLLKFNLSLLHVTQSYVSGFAPATRNNFQTTRMKKLICVYLSELQETGHRGSTFPVSSSLTPPSSTAERKHDTIGKFLTEHNIVSRHKRRNDGEERAGHVIASSLQELCLCASHCSPRRPLTPTSWSRSCVQPIRSRRGGESWKTCRAVQLEDLHPAFIFCFCGTIGCAKFSPLVTSQSHFFQWNMGVTVHIYLSIYTTQTNQRRGAGCHSSQLILTKT